MATKYTHCDRCLGRGEMVECLGCGRRVNMKKSVEIKECPTCKTPWELPTDESFEGMSMGMFGPRFSPI